MSTTESTMKIFKLVSLEFSIGVLIEFVLLFPLILEVMSKNYIEMYLIQNLIAIHDSLTLIIIFILVMVFLLTGFRLFTSNWRGQLLIVSFVLFEILTILSLQLNFSARSISDDFVITSLAFFMVIRFLIFALFTYLFTSWFKQNFQMEEITPFLLTGFSYLIASIFMPMISDLSLHWKILIAEIEAAGSPSQEMILEAARSGSMSALLTFITLLLIFLGLMAQFWTGYKLYRNLLPYHVKLQEEALMESR
ncbi:MAG: hypothetical protein ACFFC7_19380 [Candidatus Hermodarchaeota archaeon]